MSQHHFPTIGAWISGPRAPAFHGRERLECVQRVRDRAFVVRDAANDIVWVTDGGIRKLATSDLDNVADLEALYTVTETPREASLPRGVART